MRVSAISVSDAALASWTAGGLSVGRRMAAFGLLAMAEEVGCDAASAAAGLVAPVAGCEVAEGRGEAVAWSRPDVAAGFNRPLLACW